VVRVLPVEAGLIFIGRAPWVDGLPRARWAQELGPITAQPHPAAHQIPQSRRLHAPEALCPPSSQPRSG
jgi:hypothetical protein